MACRDRHHNRRFAGAAVFPSGGACLRIEVDHGGDVSRAFRRNGKVERKGRLPGAAFLAQECDDVHGGLMV